MKICSFAKKLQSRLNFLSNTKINLQKLPKIFKILTKCWNFAKSGHTGGWVVVLEVPFDHLPAGVDKAKENV